MKPKAELRKLAAGEVPIADYVPFGAHLSPTVIKLRRSRGTIVKMLSKNEQHFCNTIARHIFTCRRTTMHAATLSFRAGDDFAEQTRSLATFVGLKSSEYLRLAVAEKNERVMAERIAALSRELAGEHLAFNESTEGTLTDGLD
jgi:hypothetical protein